MAPRDTAELSEPRWSARKGRPLETWLRDEPIEPSGDHARVVRAEDSVWRPNQGPATHGPESRHCCLVPKDVPDVKPLKLTADRVDEQPSNSKGRRLYVLDRGTSLRWFG